MAILNETLAFSQQPAGVQAAFTGKSARRILLPAQAELYKFTGYGVLPHRAGSNYSPWWASVQPISGSSDAGLDGHIAAATRSGQSMLAYARETFAVMLGWNSLGITQLAMAKIVRIKLRQPVYGFGGICQRMRETVPSKRVVGTLSPNQSPLNPPIFMGGAYQLYIPNLTAAYVQASGTYLLP